MLSIGTIVSLGFAYYVYQDAKKRGLDDGALWAVATFLAWIVVLPIYYFKIMRKK
ncbi:MAG: hypothetical protein PHH31_01875 [Acidaminococcaceae bacterium]|nr:hypothetical protein [Acidaminococcaceae bacterium]MDD4721473.1 hypothetical protein [Acidaminococcaceae bacterium]